MVLQRYFQCLRDRIQLETVELRHQHSCQGNRIDYGKSLLNALPFAVRLDKSHIKRRIVCDHHASFREFQEFRQDFFDCRGVQYHVVVDTGQLLDAVRDRHFRIDKGAEFIGDLAVYHFDSTDLDDLVCHRTETGRLQVEDYIGILQTLISGIDYKILQVIHQISLASVNDLEILIRRNGVVRIRECLHNTVIRDGNRLMSPGFCPVYDVFYIGNAVHVTHFCVTVKFHSFFRPGIQPRFAEILDLFDAKHRTDAKLSVKPVDCRHATDLQKCSGFDVF